MIKLFFGNDNFRIKKEIEKEANLAKAEPVNVEGLEELLQSIRSQSFFGGKRVFVIKNKLEKIKPEEAKIIETLVEESSQDSVIFVESKEPVKKVLDIFQKKGEVRPLSDLKGVSLIKFIKERVAQEGGDIAPLAAERLAGFVGVDLWQIEEEIKKLVLYKMGSGEPIQTADVDLLVHANFESNIFNLVDAIGNKNTKKVNQLVNSFLENGENPIYILSMITRQIRNITIVKFEPKITEAEFAKRMGVHPFVAKKTVSQASNFTPEELRKVYKKLVWADLRLKSGYEPNQVLEMLVV